MSRVSANCPNCGAPVIFLWSGAVQTTCEFCHSILVRSGDEMQKVGEVSDLPPDSSPIQIGTEGIFGNKAFTVVGRIIYDWENGSWNEWNLVYQDGTTGWLSDAQLEYDVSFLTDPGKALSPPEALGPGVKLNFNGVDYESTVMTSAHYRGVQGELPFQYWSKADVPFVDLRTADGRFGTIDFSENPPLLFLGQPVEFDDLKLKNLREFEGWS